VVINPQQKKILLASGIVIGVMLLFPPFVTHLPNGALSNEGFSFLLLPPKGRWSITPSVNTVQLIVQWLAVFLIGGIAFFLSGLFSHETKNQAIEPKVNPFSRAGTWLKLIGPLLRIGRGILILFVVFIAIGLLTSTVEIFSVNSEASEQIDWGKFWAFLLLKTAIMVIIMVVISFLNKAINHIYKTKFGRSTDVIAGWRDL
jgi:hypothetical protein